MKKQKLVCALLLVVLLLPMLSACGFGGGDALVEYIEIETLEDGSTQVVVQYLDEDPKTFTVPVGVTPEKGDPGNGIKTVLLSEKTETGEQTLTLTYTDEENYPPTVIKVKDGATVVSAERQDFEEEGRLVPYMVITLSDGTTQNVKLPQGATGVGIGKIEKLDMSNKMLVYYTDHTEENPHYFECELPRGVGYTGKIRTQQKVYDDNGENLGLRIQFQLDIPDTELDENGKLQYKLDEEGNLIYSQYSDGVFIPYPKNGQSISNVKAEPFELTVDGVTRTGTKIQFFIQSVDENGNPAYDENGNPIEETVGKEFEIFNGANIDNIVVDGETDEGDPILKITMTDGTTKTVSIPKAEAIGIKSISVDTDNTDPTKYALKVTYTDNTVQNVSFPKNSAWHKGEGDPNNKSNFGSIGDYYFDHKFAIIYYKSTMDSWEQIANIGAGSVKIVFSINFEKGETWKKYVASPDLSTCTVTLSVGTSFAAEAPDHYIPIPSKDGYTFVGWYTSRDPEVTDGMFNSMTVIPNTDQLTLYPVWTPNN
jgi:uncharacterized repeat protein (TIGR02543 family)